MTSPRIGVIGIPGKWSTEVLADRIEERTGFRSVIDMSKVVADLEHNSFVAGDCSLDKLDGLAVKKISAQYSPAAEDRVHLLTYLQDMGVAIHSSPRSINRLINRLSGTLALRQAGVPMPKTYATECVRSAVSLIDTLGEVVVKPLYSTKARGMFVLSKEQEKDELEQSLTEHQKEHALIYLQQKIPLDGKDLGMVFIGGEYICTYARVSASDSWNTTIHSGGHYELYEPSNALIELGKKAQASFNLSFTTVDIALTPDGPVVFEVSAFGGFKGALQGCDLDVAALYADYLIEQVKV